MWTLASSAGLWPSMKTHLKIGVSRTHSKPFCALRTNDLRERQPIKVGSYRTLLGSTHDL